MKIQEKIKEILRDALVEIDLERVPIELEHPQELSHGDYASNIALQIGSASNKNPRELAQKIVEAIDIEHKKEIRAVEVAGPGFINFYLSNTFFVDQIRKVNELADEYGKTDTGAGQKVVVEYSSPNIAKPFTVGHLRSTIIGDAVANLLSYAGYEVIRDNHLGDWGTQYGKLVVAIQKWGDIEKIQESADPIKELVDLYVTFHKHVESDPELEEAARAAFKALEEGDEEANELWELCKELSLNEFQKTYDRLGITFDTILGESFFSDKTDAVIKKAKDEGVAKESEGALLIFFDDEDLPPLMIQKKDGSTLYATRDLATDIYRKVQYGDDVMVINEVGSEQELYFRQLFAAEEMLGIFKKEQRVHVKHGLFRFKEGKMSTREGNVIWLEDILDEAVERAAQFNPDVAEAVGVGAVKYNDLKRESIKNITFDWDEVLNLEGNSGPYLQYTYARTQSVLKKAKEAKKEPGLEQLPEEITEVERLLYRFPEVVDRSAREYAPHHLCTYLYSIAQAFNGYYGTYPIIDSEEASYRLALTAAVGQVLHNGLRLLGITAVEHM